MKYFFNLLTAFLLLASTIVAAGECYGYDGEDFGCHCPGGKRPCLQP